MTAWEHPGPCQFHEFNNHRHLSLGEPRRVTMSASGNNKLIGDGETPSADMMGCISWPVIKGRLKKLIHHLHGERNGLHQNLAWNKAGTFAAVRGGLKITRGIRLPGPYPPI